MLHRNCLFLQGENRDYPELAVIREALREGREVTATLRNYRKDGSMFWNELTISPIRDAAGKLTHFLGFQEDVTDRKQTDRFLELENQLLAAVARGIPNDEALLLLVRFIEEQADGMIASVQLLDSDGVRLRHAAAPGLAATYNAAVDGVRIGEGVGSCGTAAFRREPVYVDDIETDPLWAPYRDLTRPQGLRACWSTPIQDPSGTVLGTFAIYSRKPGLPNAQHLRLMEAATDLASMLLARHRDQQRLLESERSFRTIFEQAAVGVAHLDTVSGIILQANPKYCEILGVPERELLGKTWMELTHPEDLADDLASMDRLRHGEIREFSIEKRLRRGDGSFVCTNLIVSPTWMPGERPTTHIALVDDITERKRVEEQLRLTQFSVDSCSTSIFWIRRDASFLYVNDAATDRFGYSRSELFSMTVHDLDPAYSAEIWPTYWERMRQSLSLRFESQILHKDGTSVSVEITTNLLNFEGQELVFAFVTDITRRKRIEEALRTNAERLDMAMSVNNDGMYDWDVITNGFYFDPRYYTMAGYEPNEFASTYEQWAQRVHPQDYLYTKNVVRAFLAGDLSKYDEEYRFKRKDGNWMWIRARVKVVSRNKNGKPLRIIGTHTDVTERKLAEASLRHSEERFRSLVETAPFGVQRNDFNGKITFANAALGKIYGCHPEELVGSEIWDFAIDQRSEQEMRRYVARQAADPEPVPGTFEIRNRTRDGRIIDVSIDWTYDLDPDGNISGFIVIVTDITGRKESERALAFQADVLNRVSDAVLVISPSGQITYANEVAERLFCRSRRSDTEWEIPDFYHEVLVKGHVSELVRASLEKSGTWQGENVFLIDGETRSFETKLKTFQLPNRDERLMLAVVRDISMRNQAEQERRQHRDVLAHMTRLSTMGELVAGIAHEVRQPLYAIANFATAASISLRSVDPEQPIDAACLDDLREFNDGVRRASARANEIIKRLREFARKGEQRRENIKINHVVRDSIELVAFEARQYQATVETELAGDLPDVLADRIQCEQVIVNLLHNAYEAFADRKLPRRVILRTRRAGEFLEIQVEDNGPGIPPDDQLKCFEAFHTTKREGMGMGLAISRTIVEDHDGRLWVTTNPHGGATFHVTLPVTLDPNALPDRSDGR